jgi:formate dehydrogenase iron-sulfur subunit
MSASGILVDVTRCTGCERCVEACVSLHKEDRLQAETDRYTARDGLSARRLVSILPVGEDRYARKSCMHCQEPSCVSACLVGALEKHQDTGAVTYDASKCIGCRYCMLACPFHVPRYEWQATLPYVRKCDLCVDRTSVGEKPACVEACTHDALTFGGRDDLVRLAERKIADADRRYEPRIWGRDEFGGTSVMYISDTDLSTLDWPAPMTPSASSVAMPVVEATPIVGATVMSSLLGLNWIIKRRMARMGALEGTEDES